MTENNKNTHFNNLMALDTEAIGLYYESLVFGQSGNNNSPIDVALDMLCGSLKKVQKDKNFSNFRDLAVAYSNILQRAVETSTWSNINIKQFREDINSIGLFCKQNFKENEQKLIVENFNIANRWLDTINLNQTTKKLSSTQALQH